MASAAVKVKPINRNQAGPSSSSSKPILKKKIETSTKHSYVPDTKNSIKSIPVKSAKSEDKGKAVVPATPVKKKREKKVYSLTGQKYDPPEEREPLRIFYESLSKQIPTSEMAEFWLMEHGLLSPDRAKKTFERKQRKQKQLKIGTPMKSAPSSSRPESSRQKLPSKNGDMKAKNRMVEDSDDEVIGIPKRRKA